jgi:hypothetical protein
MSKTPSRDGSDKDDLRNSAAKLIRILSAKFVGKPVKFADKSQPELEDVYTDGWGVGIATMGRGLPKLEVWLDRMNRGAERHFWFGFAASRLAVVGRAYDSYPGPISPREIADDDVVKNKGSYSLSARLKAPEAANPILESYHKTKEFYFGIYEITREANNLGLDIQRAVKFFVPVVRSLLMADLGQIEPAQYEFLERLKRDRQGKFRADILAAYEGACALTGCQTEECLEATHLNRFAESFDNRVTNGILLRADLHRLMDAGLMTFLWSRDGLTANIDPSIAERVYRDLNKARVSLPSNRSRWPSKESVQRHALKIR